MFQDKPQSSTGCRLHDLTRAFLASVLFQLAACITTFGTLHLTTSDLGDNYKLPSALFAQRKANDTSAATVVLIGAYATYPLCIGALLMQTGELLIPRTPKACALLFHTVFTVLTISFGSVGVTSITLFVISAPSTKRGAVLRVFGIALGFGYLVLISSFAGFGILVNIIKRMIRERAQPNDPTMSIRQGSKPFNFTAVHDSTISRSSVGPVQQTSESLADWTYYDPANRPPGYITTKEKKAKECLAKESKSVNSLSNHPKVIKSDFVKRNPECVMSTAQFERKYSQPGPDTSDNISGQTGDRTTAQRKAEMTMVQKQSERDSPRKQAESPASIRQKPKKILAASKKKGKKENRKYSKDKNKKHGRSRKGSSRSSPAKMKKQMKKKR